MNAVKELLILQKIHKLSSFIHPLEGKIAEAFSNQSRRESFLAGRAAAHLGLDSQGFSRLPILRSPKGAPLWPTGVKGSISHKGDLAVAVVLPKGSKFKAVGVDLETLTAEINPNILGKIASKTEQANLGLSDEVFGTKERQIFTLKEAVFKCLHPVFGVWFGFLKAEVIALDSESAEVQLDESLVKLGFPEKLMVEFFWPQGFVGSLVVWQG
ncbi:MAG: 4'-phosphopantetheinyl transferase superfamily protein [SAR324 cluster bacterium]|nr:4'-phosphopantetheinyl transferase superfamily protein [SAR324 cluster bacterium]